MSPKTFSYLEHLKHIDLSNNKLANSKTFEETVQSLFRSNLKLEHVSLARSTLTYLPWNVFEPKPNLRHVDLSGNQFSQITFKVALLLNLKCVNLKDNSIEYLNIWARNQRDQLYFNKQHHYQNNTKTSKTFVIDLRNNPLSCDCHPLEFIKSFVNSPVFDGTRTLYHCKIDKQHIPMNIEAINAAMTDCDKPMRERRRLLLSIVLPLASLGLLSVMSLILLKRFRRQRLQRRMKGQLSLLQEDDPRRRFPVFLSFSSEEANLFYHT